MAWRWLGAAVPVAVLVGTMAGRAADGGPVGDPVVVELFTSQSCASCPPAEAYLGELAARSDIIALEWHVDYWNALVHGAAGRWRDPLSSPAYTARQRAYAVALGGGGRVYTPQMVIDGRVDAVGSDRRAVADAIADARTRRKPASVAAARDGREVVVTVTEGAPDAVLHLVHFRLHDATDVAGGENNGLRLVNHNVVTSVSSVADWRAGVAVRLPAPLTGEGCVALLQRNGAGPVVAAAACPAAGG